MQPSGLGGSAATAGLDEESGVQESRVANAAVASMEQREVSRAELQAQVIEALERANSRTPIVEVAGEGAELVIKVGMAQTLVDSGLALSEDARQGAVAAAVRALGRPVKLRVVGIAGNGGNPGATGSPRPPNGPGARSRAADDPVVRRVQEKFGAQIRTVIDHREKR